MKTILRALSLLVCLLASTGLYAQKHYYDVPELKPEYKASADLVTQLNMEDPEKANKEFMKLIKQIQKKKEDLVAVGTYFLDNNNYPAAKQCAEKVNPNTNGQVSAAWSEYTPAYMFCSEVFMKAKKYGEAGSMIDQVLSYDPDNVNALQRLAFLFKNVNEARATEALEHIIQIQPDNYDAYRQMGDIAYKLEEFEKAVEAYNKYFDLCPKTKDELDLYCVDSYMLALYQTKRHEQLSSVLDVVEPLNPQDIVVKRLRFYSCAETLQDAFDIDAAVAKAEGLMGYILNKEYNDSVYKAQDYQYMALVYNEKGAYDEAIAAYEQVLKIQPDFHAMYKEIAQTYRKAKQGDKAIEYFRIYLQKMGDKAGIRDRMQLGLMLQAAASSETDPEKKEAYIQEGDKAFVDVIEHQPDYYQAWQQRAVINIRNSQEAEDLPKQYFEKALSLMPDEDSSKSYRLTANQYIAFYHITKDELDAARKYVDTMLAIDPDFAMAVNMDKYLKQNGK